MLKAQEQRTAKVVRNLVTKREQCETLVSSFVIRNDFYNKTG